MRTAMSVCVPAVVLAACGEDPVTGAPVATAVQVVSGSGQTGTPGYRLGNEVVVRVTDPSGVPIPGETVTFSTTDAYAVPEPATVVTDDDGIARTWWRLGAVLGTQRLLAQVGDLPSAQLTATGSSLAIRSLTGDVGNYCVVDSEGILSCGGHPGFGTANPPARVVAPGTTRFTEVVSPFAASSGCAIAQTGRLWCFTRAADGSFATFNEVAGAYPALHGLVGISLGSASYCGLSATGQGWCWGHNTSSNPLDAPVASSADIPPTAISTTQPFAKIRLGFENGCGLTAEGVAWCWGQNDYGKAGQPIGVAYTRPAVVNTAVRFADIAFDYRQASTCGVAVQGGVWCWGFGSRAADPALVATIGPTPVALAGFGGARDIAMHGPQFSSLHAGTAGATSQHDGEFAGSLVWRAADFGGLVLDSFIDGKQSDLVCGRVAGSSAVICRTVKSKLKELRWGESANWLPILGIPPQ